MSGQIAARAAGILAAFLTLGNASAAGALSCTFHPFQEPGARFAARELAALGQVLDEVPDNAMTVRIFRVLREREGRPVIGVDVKAVLGWQMPRRWGFEGFGALSRWLTFSCRPETPSPAGNPISAAPSSRSKTASPSASRALSPGESAWLSTPWPRGSRPLSRPLERPRAGRDRAGWYSSAR